MNCTDARAALPLLIYGELGPQEGALRQHLTGCPACRHEYESLQGIRRALDAVPTPRVEVDLPRLYQSVADRQAQRLRRWRRIAVALSAAAAVLLMLAVLRVQIRLDAGQLLVRWGEPPGKQEERGGGTAAAPVQVRADPTAAAETEAQLRLLSDLIHALKDDGDDRDQRFQQRLDRLQDHVRALQTQADQRWTTTEQDMAALYVLARKGENP